MLQKLMSVKAGAPILPRLLVRHQCICLIAIKLTFTLVTAWQ